jgi:hypothetical protein
MMQSSKIHLLELNKDKEAIADGSQMVCAEIYFHYMCIMR